VHRSRPFNHEDPFLELGGVQVQMILAEVFHPPEEAVLKLILSLQPILFFQGLNLLFCHLSLIFLVLRLDHSGDLAESRLAKKHLMAI
jgi:hypothetical protein